MLTGQLIFRDTGQQSHRKGHKLMMVCGIVAVPNNTPLKGERQYLIIEELANTIDDTVIRIRPETEVDLTKELKGVTLDGMVTGQFWRV